MTEEKQITVKAYRDKDGLPTCAASFPSGQVCMFLYHVKFGTMEICSVAQSPLQRRGQDQCGSLIPCENCIVWKGRDGMKITLPIPDREVSPNASRGQSRWAAIKKSKLVKKHRNIANYAVSCLIDVNDHRKPVGYSLAHFFPTMAFRDEDNADGACKAYRDGICDAFGMSDKNFCKLALSTRENDASNPRVEITIYFEKP